MIRCVFLTPSDDLRLALRRYTTPGVERSCPKNPTWGCDASVVLGTVTRPGAVERAQGGHVYQRPDGTHVLARTTWPPMTPPLPTLPADRTGWVEIAA